MKVTVWDHGAYDIASPYEEYNLLLFKEDIDAFIQAEQVVIGDYEFIPGEKYYKFGTQKKTSAGFTWFDSPDPIVFHGHYDGYILFTRYGKAHPFEHYASAYFAWAFDQKSAILITINRAGSGRITHMN